MPSRLRIVLVVMLCAGIGVSAWCDVCSGQVAAQETQPSAQARSSFLCFLFRHARRQETRPGAAGGDAQATRI